MGRGDPARQGSRPSKGGGRSGARPGASLPWWKRLPEVDRIVLVRVAVVLIVIAFLALLVKAASMAFRSPETQAQRVERMMDEPSKPGAGKAR
jgi:hypothetical protein